MNGVRGDNDLSVPALSYLIFVSQLANDSPKSRWNPDISESSRSWIGLGNILLISKPSMRQKFQAARKAHRSRSPKNASVVPLQSNCSGRIVEKIFPQSP